MINDKVNAQKKIIKTKLGRWTLLQTIKINKEIKIKCFGYFVFFLDFMRKKS